MIGKSAPPLNKPAPPSTPSIEDVHEDAGDLTFGATLAFEQIITELTDANARYDDVEMRATAEIERLTLIRNEATDCRRKNVETIASLQAILGG